MVRPFEQEFPIDYLEPLRDLLSELGTLPTSALLLSTELKECQVSPTSDLPLSLGLWISDQASLHLQARSYNGQLQIAACIDPDDLETHLQDWQTKTPQPLGLDQAIALHQPWQNNRPNPLMQQMLTQLLQKAIMALPASHPSVMACQPIVNAALSQQLAQDGLIHRVTTQIRQSLELPKILSTAADQVRQILNADRFVVYQFQVPRDNAPDLTHGLEAQLSRSQPQPAPKPDPVFLSAKPCDDDCMGTVTYESCRDTSIVSTLNYREKHCWKPTGEAVQRYKSGQILAIADVHETYQSTDCMMSFLETMQVRAKLVVPVLVKAQLWGLLIAHQCLTPREWEESEINFVEQIAEHLSVAIAQSQLYHQLHEQKATLELQVQQRTQELQDALIRVHAANQAKSEFLATMSHELRTPLTCVIGMSATLLRWSLGPLTEKQRSYLQTIHDSGEHLLDLINDILDLSNVEAGRASLNITEFSISSLAHQSLQMLRDKAHASNITLKAQFEIPSGGDRFMADPRRIKQILFNLLSNSLKFTPAGGTVILRVWREANSTLFQVEDTGIGIPTQQQSKLFQKFQQLDTSYRRSYEGTGLGLALVKQFVDMHNGWIEVESEEGKGATFTVEIPNQTTKSANGQEQRIELLPRIPLAGNRILLIDPQDEQASFICDILTAAGYQVVWLVDRGAALPQVKILQPMLVILEADEGNARDLKIIRSIREAINPIRTKILVLTSVHSSPQKSVLLEAGADTCLQKPINPEHLIHKVETILLPSSK